ncbi:MAG: LysR substrate-binding domain-containing protein [Rubritepida sp.]|nr:LysR substrate-binding domain-containing protein [Rubritepida sp.]
MADLEARLGARLFHRSPAGVALTEDGALFLAQARAALEAADAAMGAVGARHGEVSGRVRLGCGVAFGRLMVVPRLAPLLARHPGLSVDLVLSDAAVDLVQEGLDASFRIGHVTDPAVVARRVGVTRRAVVAAPDHLARHGEPRHPRELAARDCVIFTGLATGDAWPFAGPEGPFEVNVAGRFRANSSEAVREAVLAGIGPALVPLWLLGPELAAGRVRALLPDFTPAPLPIHLVLPTRRQVPARVRALVEHIAEAFRAEPLLAEMPAAQG